MWFQLHTVVLMLMNSVLCMNTSDFSITSLHTATETPHTSLTSISDIVGDRSTSSIVATPIQGSTTSVAFTSDTVISAHLSTVGNSDVPNSISQVDLSSSSDSTSFVLLSSRTNVASPVAISLTSSYHILSSLSGNTLEMESSAIISTDLNVLSTSVDDTSYSNNEIRATQSHSSVSSKYSDVVSSELLNESLNNSDVTTSEYLNFSFSQNSSATPSPSIQSFLSENPLLLSTFSYSKSIDNVAISQSIENPTNITSTVRSDMPLQSKLLDITSSQTIYSTMLFIDSINSDSSVVTSLAPSSILESPSCLDSSIETCSQVLNEVLSSSQSSLSPSILQISSSTSMDSFMLQTSFTLSSSMSSISSPHSSSQIDIDDSTIPQTNNSISSVITPVQSSLRTQVREGPSNTPFVLHPSPTPTQTTHDQTVSYVTDIDPSVTSTNSTPGPKIWDNFRIAITFKDHCQNLKTSESLLEQFSAAVVAELRHVVGHATLEDIHCDPLTAVIVLHNVSRDTAIHELDKHLGNASFIVPVIYDGQLLEYTAASVSMFVLPTNNDPRLAETVMDELDIAIIAIGSFLFMVLIFFSSIVICRQCYLRKRAASFNLLDAPRSDLKLTDYTLTRIPRPRVIYCQPKRGRPRQALSDSNRTCRAYHSTDTTNNVKVALNAEDIHVRMHDHAEGLVVGITCAPPSPVHDSAASTCSSPRSDSEDQSTKQLLKRNNPQRKNGTENPNFDEGEFTDKTDDSLDLDKEEQMV